MSQQLHPVVETAKQERTARGLTLRAMAERSGLSHTTILAWESGNHDPYLSAVSDYLTSMGLKLTVVPATEPAKPLTRLSVDRRDELLSEMLPTAARLAGSVRVWDSTAVAELLEPLLHPLDLSRLLALLVATAAMVPDDATPDELVEWSHGPHVTPEQYLEVVNSSHPDRKECTECKVPKPPEEFYVDNSKDDGLTRKCGACIREQVRQASQEVAA